MSWEKICELRKGDQFTFGLGSYEVDGQKITIICEVWERDGEYVIRRKPGQIVDPLNENDPRHGNEGLEKMRALWGGSIPVGGGDGEGCPAEDVCEQDGSAAGEGAGPEDDRTGAWHDQAQALRLCLDRLG